jgi:hypothetical protein
LGKVFWGGKSDSELESEEDGEDRGAGRGCSFPDIGLVETAGAAAPFLRFGGARVGVFPKGEKEDLSIALTGIRI